MGRDTWQETALVRTTKEKKKAAAKNKATSNLVEQHSEYDMVYISSLEFESYAAAKVKITRPSTIKAHHALKGTMFIHGKEARLLFDTGMIEANLISAAFVTRYGIPCTAMKELTKILMAMKGSQSESHTEYTVDLAIDKLRTKGNKMLVENVAKYDALIGMPFLKQQEAIIKCGVLAIHFPKFGIRVNCPPTSGTIRAAVVTTKDVMNQHPDVCPEVIPEGLLPLRKINHEIHLKPRTELGTLSTYSIPECWAKDICKWINEKMEQGIIVRKMVHGAAPIFAQEKKDKVRMRPLVDHTARKEISIK